MAAIKPAKNDPSDQSSVAWGGLLQCRGTLIGEVNDGSSAVTAADATLDEASLLHTRKVMRQSRSLPSHVLCQSYDSHLCAVGFTKTHEHLKVLHRQLSLIHI